MSNLKISELPIYSGDPSGLWFPVDNAALNTTYRAQRELVLSGASGTSGTSGISGSSGTSGTSGLGWNWQGGWSIASVYYINDVVYYNGSSYVALTTIPAGQNPPDANAGWEYVAIAGSSGTSGTSGVSGSSGTDGTSGTSGVSGSSGTSGTSGINGTSGTDGTSGTSGVNGTSGTSGTSGQSNSVYSGGTLVVPGATILNFSGATITSGGTGQANITINESISPFTYTSATSAITPSFNTKSFSVNNDTGSNTINSNSISFVNGKSNTLGGVDTYQVVFGKNNTSNYTAGILNTGSFLFGENNTGGGRMTTAWGYGNSVTGWDTHAFGDNHNLTGQYNGAFGQTATISSNFSFAVGDGHNLTSGNYQYAFGNDNDITTSSYSGIFGGLQNRITGSGNVNGLFASSASTITGGTRVVGLGLNGRTGLSQSNTTYVENFNSFGLAQIGSGNTFNYYSGSNLKNALVVGNRNKVDGVANTPVMFIGNDMDSQQFGSYALHIGNNHYASGSYNLSIGDSGIEMNGNYGLLIGHSGGKQAHKAWGTDNYNLGQSNQTQGITGAFTFGKNHTISNGTWGSIFGGIDNTISSSGDYNTLLGGSGSTITGGTNVVGIGLLGRTGLSQSNTTYVENLKAFGNITNTGGTANGLRSIVGGNNSSSSCNNSIVWGNSNTVNAGGESSSAVFGSNNTVNSAGAGGNNLTFGSGNQNTGYYSFVGGEGSSTSQNNNIIVGFGNTSSAGRVAVLGGGNNTISNSTNSSILGGESNTISSSNNHNSIIGSTGSTITGGTRVIAIGLNGRTGLNQSNTTYTENTHAFRTYSTAVQAISSGTTFTCNLDNGGKAQYYLTANTTIDITNVRDGQSFMIKTQTDGNYTITWTATGYTFEFEGGTKDPGNTTKDIFVFEVFGTTIYGNRRHNYL